MSGPYTEREEIVQVFVRVCRDSRFQMTPEDAARLTSTMLDLGSPLVVWARALSLYDMERIADGSHPCLSLQRYGDARETGR